ncbi:uncharacterized protein M421DRAFT_103483 [Didymella exigua CBS 183.55]|uniref:Protein kinase domain-containing protein n=1 Tax=Didymella exigua CBS 183.55 TaxID=1150837 RepID=A0A6A5RCC6_9PLEO|nr:uncharacterized protein M421DRAFT_103483 [Didymella exigua CBS 183.55]KAF1924940.1 hypothetical protein M421DRAFT_103483 [Didymella exigua CBS 183.55]
MTPVFSDKQYDYDLPSDCILPFTKDYDASKTGAFASVSKIRIHPENQEGLETQHSPNAVAISQAIEQLRGLADGLDHLHNPRIAEKDLEVPRNSPDVDRVDSIRHGDLKPQNILRFLDKRSMGHARTRSELGVLKIADMGLAKRHTIVTELRDQDTSQRYGTIRYEAPEVLSKRGRSRLYDVWSMGCLTLEYIIWLLHGHDTLEKFRFQIIGDTQYSSTQFFQISGAGEAPQIHPVVAAWIDHILRFDPECSQDSAIKDLLEIVRKKLLVVTLKPNRMGDRDSSMFLRPKRDGDENPLYRATAAEFRGSLDKILNKILIKGTKYLQIWEHLVYNVFAEEFIEKIGASALAPPEGPRARLCQRCTDLDFWIGGFSFEDSWTSLAELAQRCNLCALILRVQDGREHITIERHQSTLELAGSELPILSIFRSPSNIDNSTPIQMGSPTLPNPETDGFFDLLKFLLDNCDLKHEDCGRKLSLQSSLDLPTRLIDVGTLKTPQLRLVKRRDGAYTSARYVFLSHIWGDTSQIVPFVTLRQDPTSGRDIDHFKKVIPYDLLPRNFQDAVRCTRALGIRYLWIDADTFGGAYCALAATRATGQNDGFLGFRLQSAFVTIQRKGEDPFYISEWIDDFQRHVIEGSLHRRGWVLQERALARRTIHFTERQTYFECGNGVRCETLASLHNTMTDFLRDPNFPEKIMRHSRAAQIESFQSLYSLYSRLSFVRWEDRPAGIAGLEKRILRALGTKGGFGIFDDGDKSQRESFHRSVLWYRGAEEEFRDGLKTIDFPADRHIRVPSWSWMAYSGGVDYVDVPGDTVDWEFDNIAGPWTRDSITTSNPALQNSAMAIPAIVRDFNVGKQLRGEVDLRYDMARTAEADGHRPQCVIVAKDKRERSEMKKRYYMLLVVPKRSMAGRDRNFYGRIGAGYMMGKYINLDSGTKVEIQ